MATAGVELAVGLYLLAGPAAYRIEALGDDAATVRILAPASSAVAGRAVRWPLRNLRANIAGGFVVVAREWAAPAAGAAQGPLLGGDNEV